MFNARVYYFAGDKSSTSPWLNLFEENSVQIEPQNETPMPEGTPEIQLTRKLRYSMDGIGQY